MENQSPKPNTTDEDKPELPADGCSTLLIGGCKDGERWRITPEQPYVYAMNQETGEKEVYALSRLRGESQTFSVLAKEGMTGDEIMAALISKYHSL